MSGCCDCAVPRCLVAPVRLALLREQIARLVRPYPAVVGLARSGRGDRRGVPRGLVPPIGTHCGRRVLHSNSALRALLLLVRLHELVLHQHRLRRWLLLIEDPCVLPLRHGRAKFLE